MEKNLNNIHCQPCEGGIAPMTKSQITKALEQLPKWLTDTNDNHIQRRFEFKGFYKTMSFVNAVAWIANQEGHHPTLEIGYDYCMVQFTTHAIQGLSDNDFICAAKVDALIRED